MKLFFLLLVSGIVHAETITVGFDDLPGLVISQNKNVLAGQAFVKGAKAQTGHLTRSFLPQVQAHGGGEIFKTGNVGTRTEPAGSLEGQINLFRSGKDVLEAKIRKRQEALSKTGLTARHFREIVRARTFYADALFYREGISGVQDVLTKTGSFSGLVGKKIEAGLTSKADQLELSIFRSRLQQEKALLQEDYEHALNDLKVSLGLSLTTDLRLRALNLKTSRAQVSKPIDTKSHHEVAALKEKSAIARLQKKQAARWWAPTLETYGSYALHTYREREYPTINDRDEAVGGLRVSMNLFDGFNGASISRSYGYQAQGYALEATQRGQELEAHQERLLHELKTRSTLIGLLHQNVSRGNRYLEMTLDEYQRGIRSSSDLFSALREHFDERKRLAETRRDYIRIKSELMALAGE